MSERLGGTLHGDAPVSAAHEPDARAAALRDVEADDEFVARTMTIARPADQLYAFLGNSPNLRELLGEQEDVDWETVLVQEEVPGRAITWRSSGHDDRRFSGRIELREAPAGRGTEVTVTVVSEPRGVIARAVDKLTGQEDPRLLSRHALRRFKQLMETGEVATSAPGPAAPRGE